LAGFCRGDGVGTDLTAFINEEMRNDWENHREPLMAFWRSGQTSAELPDCLPWLFFRGSPHGLP